MFQASLRILFLTPTTLGAGFVPAILLLCQSTFLQLFLDFDLLLLKDVPDQIE
jgi:hypothetical protein